MEIIKMMFDFILHIDTHLGQIIATYGVMTYVILFAIIFMETGLVFTPFLPGDSLLFAAGAFAALGSLNIGLLLFLLFIAATLGDTANYWIGHFFGKKIIAHPRIPIDEEHIKETQKFYKKHGGKTIIIARFIPLIRTFAPFVAGIGTMDYMQFLMFNVIGAAIWVLLATLAGFFFGNIPFVRENFSLVIIGVVVISVIPVFYEILSRKMKRNR
jgi:membrane-associated protein